MATKFKLAVGNLTDVGLVRSRNEDYYGKYEGHFGSLFLVCDGMGGHARGDIASRIAVDTIKEYFQGLTYPINQSVENLIERSIAQAHQNILQHVQANPDHTGTGTTLVLLLIKDDQYWYAHVGDSRIYMKQGNAIHQITKDHSEVQGMVDAGILTPEQAKDHPRKNFIARALGANNASPDISGPHKLMSGDIFMMCSDGLSGYFEPEEINEQLSFEPQLACQNLVQIAKDRGGADNITVQIISARSSAAVNNSTIPPMGYVGGKPRRAGRTGLIALVALFLLVIAGAAYVLFFRGWLEKRKQKEPEVMVVAVDQLPLIEHEQDSLLTVSSGFQAEMAKYQEFINTIDPKGKINFKVIADREADFVSRLVPGRAIYMPYNYLANTKGLKDEHIQFLILATVAVSQSYPASDTLNLMKYYKKLDNVNNIMTSAEIDAAVQQLINQCSIIDPELPLRFKKLWDLYRPQLSSNGLEVKFDDNPIKASVKPAPVTSTQRSRSTTSSQTRSSTSNPVTGINDPPVDQVKIKPEKPLSDTAGGR